MPGTEGLNEQQTERHHELFRWVITHGPGTVARRVLDLEERLKELLEHQGSVDATRTFDPP